MLRSSPFRLGIRIRFILLTWPFSTQAPHAAPLILLPQTTPSDRPIASRSLENQREEA